MLLAGCAGTYQSTVSGPTSNLTVRSSGTDGPAIISFADLTLSIDGIDKSYGWMKIKDETPVAIPAGEPLALRLAYNTAVLFGPHLTGSGTIVLRPRAGADYVMTFWTDKKRFTVNLFEQTADGKLVPIPQPVRQAKLP